MNKISKEDRNNLIKLLQEGKDIPNKYQSVLFKPEYIQKEYELMYDGKTRGEDIIADTLAAPLQEVRTFNSENLYEDGWINKLIFGDNLMALKNLYEDPSIKGKVKLIYIDPPFATKKDFMKDEEKAYQDKVAGSEFLEFTRKRLVFLKELLSEEGSLYVHIDQKKGHYIKVLLDEIFTESNFVNEIIWGYKSGGASKNSFANKHDTLLFYSKSRDYKFNTQHYKRYLEREEKTGREIGRDPRKDVVTYYTDALGTYRINLQRDVWDDIGIVSPNSKLEKTKYPTQKPEKLLERIIKASSDEGDIVLDAFAGSGTTLAVAEKLKRKWIGIDCGKLAIYTIQKRLLNLREEIGNQGNPISSKIFTLYNAGLYDWEEIKKLDYSNYRNFVLKLFQVREEIHDIQGIEIDGYIGHENAYLWNHTVKENAKLDSNFISSLHEALAGKGGDTFYIIAPTAAFSFYEDEIKLGDTTYKTLRVPQSIISELINRGGETIKQPTKEQDVNDITDSVGFDFIQVPYVDTEYKKGKPKDTNHSNQETTEYIIKINAFKSRTITKSPEDFENYETLSMVMIDYNYDDKVFDLDDIFFAEDLRQNNYEIHFDSRNLVKKMMVIYLDIYGNEKKEILELNDFKK